MPACRWRSIALVLTLGVAAAAAQQAYAEPRAPVQTAVTPPSIPTFPSPTKSSPAAAIPTPAATPGLPSPAMAEGPGAAVPAIHAHPALWRVRDHDTTIYLFGTIHVLKPGLDWFEGPVKAAFTASRTLVLELVLPDPTLAQAIVTRYSLAAGAPPLSQSVPAAERAGYAAALARLGLPATAFDRLKPWSAANNLTVLTLTQQGYDLNSGVERTLTAEATAVSKPIIGLETLDQQLGYFDHLPQRTQIGYLAETIDELPGAAAEIGTMVQRWAKGDPAGLARAMNASIEASPLLARTLLVDRNRRWADWIAARMKRPGTLFIAVGAGHLAGGNSVLAELARRHLHPVRIAS